MKINIGKEFEKDFTTREAGERLRNLILSEKSVSLLDFSNLKVASASFFDEGIAKLALEGWSENDFEQKLKLKNIYEMDYKLLLNTCKVRGVNPSFSKE